MPNIPDSKQCLQLLTAHGAKAQHIQHALWVQAVAKQMTDLLQQHNNNVNSDIVRAGALLHDIARPTSHTAAHGLHGANLLKNQDIHPQVVACVRHHVMAGLDGEDTRDLDIDALSLVPQSIEEEIVAQADNYVGKKGLRSIEKYVEKLNRKGLNKQAERVLALEDYFNSLTAGQWGNFTLAER